MNLDRFVGLPEDIEILSDDAEIADAPDYEESDFTYRERLALLLGNPHHGARGEFATDDAPGKGDARYYVTQENGKHIVHDKLYSQRGDPYRREFKTAAQAEAKRAELEGKYGDQAAWRDKAGWKGRVQPAEKKVSGKGVKPPPESSSSAKPSPLQWEDATGQSVKGELTGRVTSDEKMGGGMNLTRLMTIESPNGQSQDVVFKPVDGERWESVKRSGPVRLSVFKDDGSMALRERAAAEVDAKLGTNVMADTRLVKVGTSQGSTTGFVDGKTLTSAGPKKVPAAEWYRLAVLDLVLGNTDRHNKQVMVDKDGHITALDHGLAFPRDNSEFRYRPPTDLIPHGTDALRTQLIDRISRTKDWGPNFAKLGPKAQAAFYQRLDDVKAALKANQIRALVEQRNKRKA